VRVEWVRSNQRRRIATTMRVGGILDVAMGSAAYGEVDDVRRSLADRAYPESSYGAFISCDPSRVEAISNRLESSDDLALVSTTADAERQVDEQMGVMFIFIGCLLGFGGILAGSVIHGISSVSLLERTRELAALRSLGFSSRATTSLAAIELAALATLGLAAGIPLGIALNSAYMASFTTDNMSFRAILPLWVHIVTACIVYGLVGISTWISTRRMRKTNLAQATKAGE